MKLSDYMTREGLDDDAMATRINTLGIVCDRSSVSRWRRGKRRPEWDIINRIAEVTNGEVTANDWAMLEAAE